MRYADSSNWSAQPTAWSRTPVRWPSGTADKGLRTFSWRWSRSHSLALTVLYRTHPTKRPFDALVVVPADVIVDQDEHLVACAFLPMLGIDGFRLHATEEPLRGGVVRGTALRAH